MWSFVSTKKVEVSFSALEKVEHGGYAFYFFRPAFRLDGVQTDGGAPRPGHERPRNRNTFATRNRPNANNGRPRSPRRPQKQFARAPPRTQWHRALDPTLTKATRGSPVSRARPADHSSNMRSPPRSQLQRAFAPSRTEPKWFEPKRHRAKMALEPKSWHDIMLYLLNIFHGRAALLTQAVSESSGIRFCTRSTILRRPSKL